MPTVTPVQAGDLACTRCQQRLIDQPFDATYWDVGKWNAPEPVCRKCFGSDERGYHRQITTCVRCGKVEDISRWWPRKYCSDECRIEARKARRRRSRTEHEVTCRACQQEFMATRADAEWCSNRCRVRAHRYRVWEAKEEAWHRGEGEMPKGGIPGTRYQSEWWSTPVRRDRRVGDADDASN